MICPSTPRHCFVIIAAVSLVGAVFAADLTGDGWPTYPIAAAPAALRPSIERGDVVIVSVQSAVLRELRAALAEGGAAHALKACHFEPDAVALRLAREEGVQVGRTSARLRNPRNAPPLWASDIVSRHLNEAARDIDGYVVDLGDRVGLLRPIVEQAVCSPCHGPAERMAPRLRAEIAARYPADLATGFRDGDLRGWFWVELPKRTRAR
jgi:hypothetical protein